MHAAPALPPGSPRRAPLWRHLLGDRLRSARHRRGETLGEVAGRAGVSPQYLSEIERGLKDPSSEMVEAIAAALDLTLVDLIREISRLLLAPGPPRAGQATESVIAFALAA